MGQQRRGTVVNKRKIRLCVAGGGTGGHLFPGVAIGKEIIRRYPESDILFITGRRRIETDILTQAGFHQKCHDRNMRSDLRACTQAAPFR